MSDKKSGKKKRFKLFGKQKTDEPVMEIGGPTDFKHNVAVGYKNGVFQVSFFFFFFKLLSYPLLKKKNTKNLFFYLL